jgi:L-iditol 2-dehydrogenase
MAGCLCEYLVMPGDSLYRLDGGVTLDQGTLSEPLAIGVYAVQQAQINSNADIAVLGAGPIGLSVLLAGRHQGMHAAYVTDKLDYRVQGARTAGAVWAGSPDAENIVTAVLDQQPAGMHAVFECAGQQDTLDQAIELLQPGGTLMLIGIPREDRISFVIDKMRRKEITVINVRRQKHCVQPTLDMIASRSVDVDFMITHRFSLEHTAEAFDLVDEYQDGVIKAMIDF